MRTKTSDVVLAVLLIVLVVLGWISDTTAFGGVLLVAVAVIGLLTLFERLDRY